MPRTAHIQHWMSPVPAALPPRPGFIARKRFEFWIWLANALLMAWAFTERPLLLRWGLRALARAFAPEHGLIPVLRSEALHKMDL